MVISLVANGLTTGGVQAHPTELFGTEVSRDTIWAITDWVLEGLAAWPSPAAWCRRPTRPRSPAAHRVLLKVVCGSWGKLSWADGTVLDATEETPDSRPRWIDGLIQLLDIEVTASAYQPWSFVHEFGPRLFVANDRILGSARSLIWARTLRE